MRTIETKVYTIDEHPSKEKCFAWIRDNWHDLNQHSVEEVMDSLKALQKEIGGEFDYSISQVPDRGEHVTFTDYDRDALCRLSADDLPLTGVCWDYEVIYGLRTRDMRYLFNALHYDTEHIYSDEGLEELCEANGYEFDTKGNYIN